MSKALARVLLVPSDEGWIACCRCCEGNDEIAEEVIALGNGADNGG